MLHTKNQSYKPSSFTEEEFRSWSSLFYVPNCDPRVEASFDPGTSYEQTWYRSSRCYMPNMKALGLPVSEKKNFEVCLLCSNVQN